MSKQPSNVIEKFRGPGFVIAATNHERQLDTAIGRRFDEVTSFERPGRSEVIRLLELKFRNFKRNSRRKTWPGFSKDSRADIERICLNAIRYAVLHRRPREKTYFLEKHRS